MRRAYLRFGLSQLAIETLFQPLLPKCLRRICSARCIRSRLPIGSVRLVFVSHSYIDPDRARICLHGQATQAALRRVACLAVYILATLAQVGWDCSCSEGRKRAPPQRKRLFALLPARRRREQLHGLPRRAQINPVGKIQLAQI